MHGFASARIATLVRLVLAHGEAPKAPNFDAIAVL